MPCRGWVKVHRVAHSDMSPWHMVGSGLGWWFEPHWQTWSLRHLVPCQCPWVNRYPNIAHCLIVGRPRDKPLHICSRFAISKAWSWGGNECVFMVGVVRRVRVLWGVGVRRRSRSIGVGVKELWFDEGGIVQELLGLCGCGMKIIIVFLQVLHVLKGWCEMFSAWTGGHARSLHAV